MGIRKDDQIKILLAEDDDDRELFQAAIKEAHANAKLKSLENDEKLMKYLAEADGQLPDIIFLDINMPCKDGKQCLKEIRSKKEFKKVPVIMFTTSSAKEDVEETFAQGANLYVPKPVSFRDEVKLLKKIFSSNWQNDLLKADKKKFGLRAKDF